MPKKAEKTKAPKVKAPTVKAEPKRPKPRKQTSPPPKIIIRNAPSLRNGSPVQEAAEEEHGIKGTHVAAGVGAGTVGTALGMVVAGQGWIGPKWTAGILTGTGAVTAGIGYYLEADHVTAIGVGLASAGVNQFVVQVGVDMYEAVEKKKAEELARAQAEEARQRLAAEAGKGGPRNRRIVIIDGDGYEMIGYEPDEMDGDDFEDNPAAA